MFPLLMVSSNNLQVVMMKMKMIKGSYLDEGYSTETCIHVSAVHNTMS